MANTSARLVTLPAVTVRADDAVRCGEEENDARAPLALHDEALYGRGISRPRLRQAAGKRTDMITPYTRARERRT